MDEIREFGLTVIFGGTLLVILGGVLFERFIATYYAIKKPLKAPARKIEWVRPIYNQRYF